MSAKFGGDQPSPHYARHSRYSDPGRLAHLLLAVRPGLPEVCEVARNVIVHYRYARVPLPESSNGDINLRRLSRILELDQERHRAPLTEARPEAERVQGCCRDQVLLAVGILRQHGIPARSRVGFANYLRPGSRADHVVGEAWIGGRWRRFDPWLAGPRGAIEDPHDLPPGTFLTAAAAWADHRRNGAPVDDLGVRIGPVGYLGLPFVLSYLIMDVAHRFGDELLLWDSWGAMPLPGHWVDLELGDRLAELVLRADSGDVSAEQELAAIHSTDLRVKPGAEVLQLSPRGEPPRPIRLA
ncbi:transglutaminase domain-containing protein [Microlunatus sp. GCM10028923]|uniref:transglutaminase domain-containing protein n=1 Tax=Microlunatus sp. GCM10028923 TaxID=3273400 RepID=UPI00361CAF14